MKFFTLALASMLVLSGCVATASKQNNKATLPAAAYNSAFGYPVPANAPSPEQPLVSSTQVDGHESLANSTWRIGKFRPNANMPEMLDKDFVSGNLATEKAAELGRLIDKGEVIVMTMPRMKLIPCDEGCTGNKGYERAVSKFLSLYDSMANSPTVAYRGEVRVKVRWFREKTFIERANPLSQAQNIFGIEFPIEGVALTLGSTCSGKNENVDLCVEQVANKFKMGVMFPLSLGLRNDFTSSLDPQYDPKVMQSVSKFIATPTRALMSFLGKTDYSSRIEPIGAQHQKLLPAIDGVGTNERFKLDEPKLFDWF